MNMVAATAPMTKREAKQCVAAIRKSLENARAQIWELYQRQGWKALGYESWRACIEAEFGAAKSQAYRQLQAAKVELSLRPTTDANGVPFSPIGEIGTVPESHLRALADPGEDGAKLTPLGRRITYEAATQNGHRTTAEEIEEIKKTVIAAEAVARAALDPEKEAHLREAAAAFRRPAKQVGGEDWATSLKQYLSLMGRCRKILERRGDEAEDLLAAHDALVLRVEEAP